MFLPFMAELLLILAKEPPSSLVPEAELAKLVRSSLLVVGALGC